MALENSDLLVVQRPGTSDLYKLAIGDLPADDSSVIISEDAPDAPSEGQLWWCESDAEEGGGRLYIYTGSEWVDISQPGGGSGEGGGASVSVSEDAPVGATEGDLWWNSDDDSGRLYVYYDDGNSQQWVEASPQGEGGGGTDVDHSNYVTLDTSQSITGKKTFNFGSTDAIVINKPTTTQYCGITFSEVNDNRYLLYMANTVDGSLNLQCRKNGTNVKSAVKINLDGSVEIPQLTEVVRTTGSQSINGDLKIQAGKSLYVNGGEGGQVSSRLSLNAPNTGNKLSSAGAWLTYNTVIGIGNNNHGVFAGNTQNITGYTTNIKFGNGNSPNCGQIQAKKDVEPRFSTTSDRRLKSNIRDAESMLEKFEQIQVRRFTKTEPSTPDEPSHDVLGFIADELQQVFPDAVEGEPNATMTVGDIVNAEGVVIDRDIEDPATSGYQLEEGAIFAAARTLVPKHQSVASSALIIPMAKAIQELIAINKDLTARIEQLESDHATLMNNNGGSY